VIDQHDRHAVAVAGGQVGVFVNVYTGESEGSLGLHLPGHAFDDVAEVAVRAGENGDFNHGCMPRPTGSRNGMNQLT
jgi:hypothetical protein